MIKERSFLHQISFTYILNKEIIFHQKMVFRVNQKILRVYAGTRYALFLAVFYSYITHFFFRFIHPYWMLSQRIGVCIIANATWLLSNQKFYTVRSVRDLHQSTRPDCIIPQLSCRFSTLSDISNFLQNVHSSVPSVSKLFFVALQIHSA